MKIIHKDESVPIIKIKPESLEDLWYLSKLIKKNDAVEGRSERRFKAPGTSRDSGEKKPVTIRIKAETVEFAESSNKLRITGMIEAGTPEEYTPRGDYHTLDVEPHEHLKIFKKLSAGEKKTLQDALQHSTHAKALVLLMDERKALAALIQTRGTKMLFEKESTASKRNVKEFEANRIKFYKELADALEMSEADAIIVAGPGFEKNSFQAYLKEKHAKLMAKTAFDYASSAEKSALKELLAKGAVEKAIGNRKQADELAALEQLKASVAKNDGNSVYGPAEVERALAAHAVERLLITDELLRSEESRHIMELAELDAVPVLAFNLAGEAGAEFSAFGVAAFLRFKMR